MERRSFLRGLTSLPLIGGSVALIGNPVEAATPVTNDLMLRYVTFLAHEHREALLQYLIMAAPNEVARSIHSRRNVPMEWVPDNDGIHNLVQMISPAKRAAVILSAAGISLA